MHNLEPRGACTGAKCLKTRAATPAVRVSAPARTRHTEGGRVLGPSAAHRARPCHEPRKGVDLLGGALPRPHSLFPGRVFYGRLGCFLSGRRRAELGGGPKRVLFHARRAEEPPGSRTADRRPLNAPDSSFLVRAC